MFPKNTRPHCILSVNPNSSFPTLTGPLMDGLPCLPPPHTCRLYGTLQVILNTWCRACLCRKGRVKFCPAGSLGKWAINVCWMNGWIMRSLWGKPPSKPTRLLTSVAFLPGGMKCSRVGKQWWLHGFGNAPESIDWAFLNDGFYELHFN